MLRFCNIRRAALRDVLCIASHFSIFATIVVLGLPLVLVAWDDEWNPIIKKWWYDSD